MMLARVTGDGYATQLGETPSVHPVYGTPSFALRAELPLGPEEVKLYRELTGNGDGILRLHIRSALAQLGADAFHPDTTGVSLSADRLIVDTLITSLNGDMGMSVIGHMRALIGRGGQPRIMHAGLLPHAARVSSADQVAALCERGSLMVHHAEMYADGSIGLPPTSTVYDFRLQSCTHGAIETILLEQGRATLTSMRDERNGLPEHMLSGEFLVTGVHLHTEDHHVVLRRITLADGLPTSVIHGESCVLHAGRTRGGSRQLELWNANGSPQSVRQLRVVADLYRADTIAEPGH